MNYCNPCTIWARASVVPSGCQESLQLDDTEAEEAAARLRDVLAAAQASQQHSPLGDSSASPGLIARDISHASLVSNSNSDDVTRCSWALSLTRRRHGAATCNKSYRDRTDRIHWTHIKGWMVKSSQDSTFGVRVKYSIPARLCHPFEGFLSWAVLPCAALPLPATGIFTSTAWLDGAGKGLLRG